MKEQKNLALKNGSAGITGPDMNCSHEHLNEFEPTQLELQKRHKKAIQTPPDSVIAERPRTLDDYNQKTRNKRQSRLLREMEQTKFSLDRLKERSTGGASPSDEKRWSTELTNESVFSPQITPDSQSSKESFELGALGDRTKSDDPSPNRSESVTLSPKSLLPLADIIQNQKTKPSVLHKLENSLPTFYIPPKDATSVFPKSINDFSESSAKPSKDRRESSRRPLVVVISMQKETLLDGDSKSQTSQTSDSSVQTSQTPSLAQGDRTTRTVLERLEKMNEEMDMINKIREQNELLENQQLRTEHRQKQLLEKRMGAALQKLEQNKQEPSGAPWDTSAAIATAPIAQPEPDFSSAPAIRMNKISVPDGWSPKLILETRDMSKTSLHEKPPTSSVKLMTERPGNLFFTPNDKASFSK